MQQPDTQPRFDQHVASNYDRQWAKLAPLRDALHLLIGAIFSDLPEGARVLCVGAGTGTEILYLARRFPRWTFTAVEPSAAMLEVCRSNTQEHGVASRCVFHQGYLDSLAPAPPFDAATSLLVSQFILQRDERSRFFRAIAQRLRPGGLLASADLASDLNSAVYPRLLEIWLQVMKAADVPAENLERLREVYGRDVAVLPTADVAALLESGGFEHPTLFFQGALMHAWCGRRTPELG